MVNFYTLLLYENGLNNSKVAVYQLDVNNKIIKKWNSQIDAATNLKINARMILDCVCTNPRRKTAGGFCWCLVDNYNKNNKIVIRGTEKGKLNQIDIKTNY